MPLSSTVFSENERGGFLVLFLFQFFESWIDWICINWWPTWTVPFTVVPTALGTAMDINLSNESLVFISVTFATMVSYFIYCGRSMQLLRNLRVKQGETYLMIFMCFFSFAVQICSPNISSSVCFCLQVLYTSRLFVYLSWIVLYNFIDGRL